MNNQFIFTGRLTKDIELKMTTSGKEVLDIPMAVNTGKDETLFITITAFGKTAEMVSKYCHKGDLIGTCGIISNHNWEDKEGKKHYDYQFLANKVIFLQTKRQEQNEYKQMEEKYGSEYQGIELQDEDLPW